VLGHLCQTDGLFLSKWADLDQNKLQCGLNLMWSSQRSDYMWQSKH